MPSRQSLSSATTCRLSLGSWRGLSLPLFPHRCQREVDGRAYLLGLFGELNDAIHVTHLGKGHRAILRGQPLAVLPLILREQFFWKFLHHTQLWAPEGRNSLIYLSDTSIPSMKALPKKRGSWDTAFSTPGGVAVSEMALSRTFLSLST